MAWLVFSAELRGAEKKAQPPNILFVFADDQAFDTIAALGNQEIQTPHLDRIVQDGMTFTHTFNQGSWSGAVCVASRCMLNTGRFLWNANRIYGQTEKERQAGRFWSEHLKKAGYETYMTGKWHVRADATKAFDRVGHVRGGMPNQTPQGYNRPRQGQPDLWKPWDEKFGGFWKGGKHWSEVVGDDAVSFLEQAAKSESPFFMYLAFNAPHDPRQSPRRFVDMYPLDKIAVPKSYVPEYPFKEAMGSGVKLRDEKLAPFPRTEYAVKVNRQEYYAIITHMDQQIGRIMEALKKTGKADNTYIFFTADHGLAVGRHGLMGKQNMFDHSVRVPFVVIGPGITGGTRSDAWIYLQDVMPTTLELAGIKKPGHVQFKSLLPLIKGETREGYDAVYGAYLALQRSVREGPYKLILYPKISQQVLYNVEQDPLELKDLAGDAKYLQVKKKLFARLLELQQQTGDQLQLTTTFADLR
ncbi:MAG: sulfatase-like hydrolase/transferase [Pirellulaceae bacterium]